jgi:high affinity Mn2+ porin
MSPVPNGKVTGLHPAQHMLVAEAEHRHEIGGREGKVKLLVFTNHARMANYDDAVALAGASGGVPDVSLVRRMQDRKGFTVNLEQEVAKDFGIFARLGANDGRKEAYEFTEINRSLSGGVSLKGSRWSRGDDTFGAAFAVNQLSSPARRYFAAGGMGILIGDGALNYASERIVEAYYAARVNPHVTLTFDVQRVRNPAYNADRGPVTIYGTRLHAEL